MQERASGVKTEVRRKAIIAELLADPPPYEVLDEAYRMWLRKLIVASGEG